MNRSDRVRRAVSLTLAVLCFLVVPQLAFGQFSSSKAPAMSVVTVKLVTPTAVAGTYTCQSAWWGLSEGADVNVTGLSVAGQPAGVEYDYTLYRGITQRATKTTPAMQAFLSTGMQASDWTTTTYRLTIVSKVGAWTAPDWSTTFKCGARLDESGPL